MAPPVSTILQLRVQLYWFLTINPYTRPWVYFISLTNSNIVISTDISRLSCIHCESQSGEWTMEVDWVKHEYRNN